MNITQEHLEKFKVLREAPIKKNQKKTISASFIYKVPALPLNAIVGEFETLKDKELKEFESKDYYGINFITLFALNKDPEVLRFILNTFKGRGLELTKLKNKHLLTNKYEIFEGDTLMSIALRQGSLDKIKTLIDYGLTEIAPKQIIPYNYRDSYYSGNKIKCNNLLEICLAYSGHEKYQNQTDFYLDFAFSYKNYEDYNLNTSNCTNVLLLLRDSLYANEKFQTDIISILGSIDNKSIVRNQRLVAQGGKYKVIENIMKYTPHLINSQIAVSACKKFIKCYEPFNGEAIIKKYEEAIDVMYEKNILTHATHEDKSNRVKKMKILKL